jgi:hypothetical protein
MNSPPQNASAPRGAAERPATQVFRLEGQYWTIGYEAVIIRLRDAKGLHYLAHLLGRPGTRVPVTDLFAVVTQEPTEVAASPERARLAVTKRVRSAIKQIGEYHAALGYHLSTTVKTGRHCAYLPDPQRPPQWEV